jgi:hypothetical protein
MSDFTRITGFDWDEGNRNKNWMLHKVSWSEAEEVFFNRPLLIYPDPQHSHTEDRFYVLGRTVADRRLFVVFTIRKNKIRVISAQEMAKKERRRYNEAAEENSEV